MIGRKKASYTLHFGLADTNRFQPCATTPSQLKLDFHVPQEVCIQPGVIVPPPMDFPMYRRPSGRRLSPIATSAALFLLLLLNAAPSAAQEGGFNGSLDAPEADVLPAVESIAKDSIVYGTYSYEKEKQLKGAKPASSVSVFGDSPDDAKVFFKILENVIAPRHFKETADLGTIYIRYIVQGTGSATTAIHIDAVYVEKNRRRQHQSDGTVEQSEFQAIKDRFEKMQSDAKAINEMAAKRPSAEPASTGDTADASPTEPVSAVSSADELEKHVADLKHRVELRTAAGGAALKAAPYRTAATLQPLPAQAELLVVVLTKYWYGVETVDGHKGWVHRSQVEPLP